MQRIFVFSLVILLALPLAACGRATDEALLPTRVPIIVLPPPAAAQPTPLSTALPATPLAKEPSPEPAKPTRAPTAEPTATTEPTVVPAATPTITPTVAVTVTATPAMSLTATAPLTESMAVTDTSSLTVTTPLTPTGGLPLVTELPAGVASALTSADAAHGQLLAQQNACIGCHAVAQGVKLVGPSWYNMADTAAKRVADQSAEVYLYNSITNPNGYVVEGYIPGLMLQTYRATLSDQDFADLIAYLLTQRAP